jgi:phosphatidylglycerophosphate synthase
LDGLILIQMMVGKVKVKPRMFGKIATVLQMIAVLWILLRWGGPWLNWWLFSAAICTGVSGLLYLWDGTRQLSAHPTSSPSPPPSPA